ncbi:MAG: response regulator [Bifidobacteriaceae bacterium]|jgi:DNA-binding response OmpR family regulator|nr:response regulator [Bifidobacteriaceae bacterium]
MTVSVPASGEVQSNPSNAVRILLYSDNARVRHEVQDNLGDTLGADNRPIQWTEAATHEVAMILCQEGTFDLIVMDNETNKLGGVGLTRQMRSELDWQPTVLLLLARQQDAWLGAWSGADAALLQPIDPLELTTTVADLVGVPQA